VGEGRGEGIFEREGQGEGTLEGEPLVYDLRGVRCPLSWARAKVRLESMVRGAVLVIRLDDPRGARDLPRAAEAAGHAVLDVRAESTEWRIVIQK
jgi:tRNA 2-thiouridine synthesizing protein A